MSQSNTNWYKNGLPVWSGALGPHIRSPIHICWDFAPEVSPDETPEYCGLKIYGDISSDQEDAYHSVILYGENGEKSGK